MIFDKLSGIIHFYCCLVTYIHIVYKYKFIIILFFKNISTMSAFYSCI